MSALKMGPFQMITLFQIKKHPLLFAALFIAVVVFCSWLIFWKDNSETVTPITQSRFSNNVLIIGDTTLNTSLGPIITENLLNRQVANKKNLYFYAVDNSTFNDWQIGNFENLSGSYRLAKANGVSLAGSLHQGYKNIPKLKDVIKEVNPKTLIVFLGFFDFLQATKRDDSQETASKKRIMEIRMQFEEILRSSQIKHCIWVGPPINPDPTLARDKQLRFLTELKFAVQSTRCQFIESTAKTHLNVESQTALKPSNHKAGNQSTDEIDIMNKSPETQQKLQIFGERLNQEIIKFVR